MSFDCKFKRNINRTCSVLQNVVKDSWKKVKMCFNALEVIVFEETNKLLFITVYDDSQAIWSFFFFSRTMHVGYSSKPLLPVLHCNPKKIAGCRNKDALIVSVVSTSGI